MWFPNAMLHNLVAAPVSDHNPILPDTTPSTIRARRRSFKFENRWLFEPELKRVVGRSWFGFNDLSLLPKIQALGETLALWGNRAYSRFRCRKEQTVERLQDISTKSVLGSREELARLLVQ